jgi:hypothetical protein
MLDNHQDTIHLRPPPQRTNGVLPGGGGAHPTFWEPLNRQKGPLYFMVTYHWLTLVTLVKWQILIIPVPHNTYSEFEILPFLFRCCSCRWGETVTLNCGHQRAYCSSSRWYMSMKSLGRMVLTGENRRTRRKTCPSTTLSTTNLTLTGSGAKPGLRCARPANNRVSHGTTIIFRCLVFFTH